MARGGVGAVHLHFFGWSIILSKYEANSDLTSWVGWTEVFLQVAQVQVCSAPGQQAAAYSSLELQDTVFAGPWTGILI